MNETRRTQLTQENVVTQGRVTQCRGFRVRLNRAYACLDLRVKCILVQSSENVRTLKTNFQYSERSIVIARSEYISKITHPNFAKFSVHITHGCGSDLIWRRCNTSCTSVFLDDVCSVLFLSRPRSKGWPHRGRTFSIYPCPLLFWMTSWFP